jgi:DNA topoisomerase-1
MPKEKTLIIVESPAKAKTISRFLGPGYAVEASFGHVRDLPQSAKEIPESVKKQPWARLGVNVDQGFEPLYVVPADKKKRVSKLKELMRGAGTVLLATDEDREGESISWHILQVAPPPKGAEVRRIVFHEVTREAIDSALRSPRTVNESLVRAQEARRVLDRLFGYTLSPLLWKKVTPGLSAGRVQSVAVRLTVERERQRIAFHPSSYWDIAATLVAETGEFGSRLIRIDGRQIADGQSFDPATGALRTERHVLLNEADANALAVKLKGARPWTVAAVRQAPGEQRPYAPFTTSTLQQEANRKLRFGTKRTMQIAQQLYEGIDLGGERVGLITYMRTDSLTMAERAIQQARKLIEGMYGREYVPAQPNRYKTKSKGAQEAHECIRPTDFERLPKEVEKYLDAEQFKLYELIWKRAMASQMVPAKVNRTQVEVTVENLVFGASGKEIVFPGYLRAYVEGSDDPEAELEDKENLLPSLSEGQEVTAKEISADGHTTKPAARYTEASLVKKLEEEGIGRPSTYATVITTIQDRGYVFKRGNELVPTFTAFAVTELLETHFDDLVDLKFTAHMEDELDEVATGEIQWTQPLREFYFGGKGDGLVNRVKSEAERAVYPAIPIGEDIVVRIGKYGPYLQRGDGGDGNVASIPEETAPAELSLEQAKTILESKDSATALVSGNGVTITLATGRYGDYLQVVEDSGVTRNVSLPRGMKASEVTQEIAEKLASLPRVLGHHPDDGDEVTAAIGRFGPFVKHGADFRSLPDWRAATEISLDAALALLKEPKAAKGQRAKPSVIQSFDGIQILNGRYGPYATDGETNATLPKTADPATISEAEARTLIEEKKKAGPVKKFKRRRKPA